MPPRNRAVRDADDARREPGGVLGARLTDGDRRHRDPGWHLHDRVQGVDAPRCCVGTGTPITGRSVHAATTPGRCAAPPAAAMTTFSPRSRALVAHSMTPRGLRCAEQTLTSFSIPSSFRTLTHDSMSGRSDLEPRMTPTTGFTTQPPGRCRCGRRLPGIVPAGPRTAPWRGPRPRCRPTRPW